MKGADISEHAEFIAKRLHELRGYDYEDMKTLIESILRHEVVFVHPEYEESTFFVNRFTFGSTCLNEPGMKLKGFKIKLPENRNKLCKSKECSIFYSAWGMPTQHASEIAYKDHTRLDESYTKDGTYIDNEVYVKDEEVYNLVVLSIKTSKYNVTNDTKRVFGETPIGLFMNSKDDEPSMQDNIEKFGRVGLVITEQFRRMFRVIDPEFHLCGSKEFHHCDGYGAHSIKEGKYVKQLNGSTETNMEKFGCDVMCNDESYGNFVSSHPEEYITHRMICSIKTLIYENIHDLSYIKEYAFHNGKLKNIMQLITDMMESYDDGNARHNFLQEQISNIGDLSKVKDLDCTTVKDIVVVGRCDEIEIFNNPSYFDIHYIESEEELFVNPKIIRLYDDINLVIVMNAKKTCFKETFEFMKFYCSDPNIIDVPLMQFFHESSILPLHKRIRNLMIANLSVNDPNSNAYKFHQCVRCPHMHTVIKGVSPKSILRDISIMAKGI